jgi:hypothetical protein
MADITVVVEKIGSEDLMLGTGTFSRTTSTGGSQTISKINAGNIPILDTLGNFVGDYIEDALIELYADMQAVNVISSSTLYSSAYASLADMIVAAGVTPCVLNINSNLPCLATAFIPPTALVEFSGEGVLAIDNGVTVTINSTQASSWPLRRLFICTGTGKVVLSKIKEVYPEWWADNTTPGTTDMTAAIQAGLDVVGAAHSTLVMQPTSYSITATLSLTLKREWKWRGIAPSSIYGEGTKLLWNGSADGTMVILYGCRWVEIDDMMLDGNSTAGGGIQFRNSLAKDVASFLTSHNVTMYHILGTPGYCWILGEGDATPGISSINIYTTQLYTSNQGVYINNGGAQNINLYQPSIVGMNTGLSLAYGGIVRVYSADMENNTCHMYCNGYQLDVYGGYFEAGQVLIWANHSGYGVNLYGTYSTEASLQPITWNGSYGYLNAIGCTWNKSIQAVTPAKGCIVINNYFVTGSWTPTANTTILSSGSIDLGATFGLDSTGGISTYHSKSIVDLTDSGATPSVALSNAFSIGQTYAQNITDFVNGTDGQKIVIVFTDNKSTLVHNGSKIVLKGSTNVTPSASGVMTLIKAGVWYEVSRNF